MTQAFPGLLAMLVARHVRPGAIIVGLVAGDSIAIGLHAFGVQMGGCNPGLVGLAVNLAIVFGTGWCWPGAAFRPVAAFRR
jgi:SSS family solute:Na+ symporter